MDGKRFLPYALVLAGLLASTDTSRVVAANMRSFIEAVRRKAAVVYVGSVKEVQLLTRTKFDIKARAVVRSQQLREVLGTLGRLLLNIRVSMIRRRCWRAVHSIN